MLIIIVVKYTTNIRSCKNDKSNNANNDNNK